VPEDIALVAFDGSKESEYSWPPLTVVRQPIVAIAKAAVDVVLNPSQANPGHDTFSTDLVIRRSCGCAVRPLTAPTEAPPQ
jgi:LacI family transcriptional regulator